MPQRKVKGRPRRDHELSMVTCNPIHAVCSCGGWRYKADTDGLTEIDAVFHVQKWFETHRKMETRAG